MADAGWYADPSDPQSLRYFDGSQWTEHRQPAGDAGGGTGGTAAPGANETVITPNAGGASDGGWGASTHQAGPSGEQPPASGTYGSGPADQSGGYGAGATGDAETSHYGQSGYDAPSAGTGQYGAPGDSQYGGSSEGQYGAASAGGQYGASNGARYGGPGDAQYGAAGSGQYGAAGGPQYGAPASGQYGTGGYGTGPTGPGVTGSTKKSKKLPVIIAAVVVAALVAAGLVYFLTRPDKPKLTFEGKKIKNADKVLSQAEDYTRSLAESRHGATNDDTRCYFAVPKNPTGGAKDTDVDTSLRCGPVLFVDGDTSRPYLRFLLTPQPSGSSTELSVASKPSNDEPESAGSDVNLKRPDGKKAPDGAGGLKVPDPPAAQDGTVTTAVLGPAKAPATLSTPTLMKSRTTGVEVLATGTVDRYGTGDDARSAPKGKRLIAVQLKGVSGEFDDSDPFTSLKFDDGAGSTKDVPEPQTEQWVVAVASSSGTPKLILTADGVTQYIDLSTGKPGPDNIQVLARTNRKFTTAMRLNITRTVSGGGATPTNQVLNTSFASAQLRYWPSSEITNITPGSPDKAYLVVDMDYNYAGSTGGPYGFDPALLRLQISGRATSIPAKNVDSGDFILDVFEVPATFTTGTIVIGGTTKLGAYTVTIANAGKISVTINGG